MLPANTIYQYYSDNVAKLATITIETGTPPDDLTAYGPETLVDDNPAKVAKIDSTTAAWQLDFGATQPLALAALIHGTFDAGGNVRLQGNATPSWGAPASEIAFTIPPWYASGTTRAWPQNPWLDLTETSFYTTGYRYIRLVMAGHSQPVQLGQLWLSATPRWLDPDVRWGVTRRHEKPIIENVTSYLVSTIYPRGTTRWRETGTIPATDDLVAELRRQWFDTDGRVYPFLLVPDGDVNRCYLVRATTEFTDQWSWPNVHDLTVTFEEVGRGLRPGV